MERRRSVWGVVCAALVAAGSAAQAPAARAVREPKSGLLFVALPGGEFHFGCEPQDLHCLASEQPGRAQRVPALRMGETLVTVAAFRRCVAAGACVAPRLLVGGRCNWRLGRAQHPMNCIDWASAQAFCAWIGGRLPTPEEMEYAAKGGASRIYPWGDDPPGAALAQFGSREGTAEVRAHPAGATPQGLLDMAGNAWQWTDSEAVGSNREARGGGWSSPPGDLRASHRRLYRAQDRYSNIGFRCALPLGD